MTRFNRGPATNSALHAEIIMRSLVLLKRSGIERVEEVDADGNYNWCREYEVEDIWVLEELYDLTVYVRIPGATDIACSLRDPEEYYQAVSHWNQELVIKALEVLRRDMVLEDLAGL